MKSDLLDDRLRLNVSVFDMDYQDMQIGTAGQDQNGRPPGPRQRRRSDHQRRRGRAPVHDRRALVGRCTIGNTDFQYTRVPTLADCLAKGFPQASCTGLIVIDSSPGRTPKYKVVAELRLHDEPRQRQPDRGPSRLQLPGRCVLRREQRPADAWARVHAANARITWLSPDGDWEAALFGTNITDERAVQSKLDFLTLFGTVQTTYVRPEEWALAIKKRF